MLKNHTDFRSRILAFAVASALGVAGTAMAAAPAGGRYHAAPARPGAPVAVTNGGAHFNVLTQATHLGNGDVVHGAVALSRPVRVTVALKLRDDAGMKAFIAKAHQPGSRHVMSQAQMQSHLPTQAQAQAVANYLKHAGFTNVHISSNRMLVNATGSAAEVQSAFKTSLVSVKTRDGRNAFANNSPIHIPASLAGSVQAVLGLQTVHKYHTLARTMARTGIGGHMPLEFADIYGASDLPAATDVNAAVWGWGSMENTVDDLTQFLSDTGLSDGNVSVVCYDYDGYNSGTFSTTDPTCNTYDMGESEWAMDSQSITAMSGGLASLTFFSAYIPYNSTMTNLLNEIVTPTQGEPLAQVINGSFGECELYADANQGGDGSAQAEDALFQLGASQGQTFTISTGDDGANECAGYFGPATVNPLNAASSPADDPWVVAVSGTTLRASDTTWARENVWLGAGGSPTSVSDFAAQPWQTDLTYGDFAGQRGPDVAFDANPASGELVLLGASTGTPGYQQWGGTSLAAPLMAGAWARILQSNPDLGFAAPNLYTLSAAELHDIRAGNNNGYIAKPGWDWATGLGSFDVGRAAAALAPEQPPE